MFNNSFKSEYANNIGGVIFFFLVALKDRRYFATSLDDWWFNFIHFGENESHLPAVATLARSQSFLGYWWKALFCHNKSRGQLRRRGYLRGASQEMTFVLCEEYA